MDYFLITPSLSCSFSLVYGEDANGQNFLGFPSTYYMFRDVGARPATELAPTVPCSIYAVFELCFALLTPTIVAADIIGKSVHPSPAMQTIE